jgi:hypothetical protein
MAKDMVKEYLLILIKINIVAGGHLGRRMAKEHMSTQTQE